MMNQEEILQKRLEELESGVPLQIAREGLSDDEAEMLALAVLLKQGEYPVMDETAVSAQRKALIAAAEDNLQTLPHSLREGGFLWSFFDWLMTRPEVTAGLVLLLTVIVMFGLWVGLTRSPGAELPVAEAPTGLSATAVSETGLPTEDASQPVATQEQSNETELQPGTAASTEPPHHVFVPIVTIQEGTSPTTAVLHDVVGLVQIQQPDNSWTIAQNGYTIQAGQRVRTSSMSAASIVFHDGSVARLKANTELSIDTLDAKLPRAGFRTVILTQWKGESEHQVQFRNDAGSRYEVKTPTASGIARGTLFQVIVLPDMTSRYIVNQGRVDVQGKSQVVQVIAGQTSVVRPQAEPEAPAFVITGEGEVTQIGTEWVVAGQTFQTGEQTVIVGAPQVGDIVFVSGHLLPDGAYMADLIVLLARAPENEFSLTGRVEMMGDDAWVVAGQIVLVTADTLIDTDVVVDSLVVVNGRILEDGSLLAESITRLPDQSAHSFKFVGIVENINDTLWTISGITIAITDTTQIEPDILVGDAVVVEGEIIADVWQAHSIHRADNEREFEFSGVVQSINPW
ncbi:MAG: hypothetical protein D6706_05610, partial [Chloroflexi bacterium]